MWIKMRGIGCVGEIEGEAKAITTKDTKEHEGNLKGTLFVLLRVLCG